MRQLTKKRLHRLADFAVPANHRVKIKESWKIVKYLDHVREQKILWNKSLTVISIETVTFSMVPKRLEKELEELEIRGRTKTFRLQYYWNQPEYSEESWRPEDTCCHSNSQTHKLMRVLKEKLAKNKEKIMIIIILLASRGRMHEDKPTNGWQGNKRILEQNIGTKKTWQKSRMDK